VMTAGVGPRHHRSALRTARTTNQALAAITNAAR
jgi:hypothetical protein